MKDSIFLADISQKMAEAWTNEFSKYADKWIVNDSIQYSHWEKRWNFKHLRDTVHTHDPLDDAIGTAESFLKIREMMETDHLE